MTDWARFLPLSNRDSAADTGVSRDRSPAVAALLSAIAEVLDARPAMLDAPTLRPAVTVEAAVREVLSELGAPWWRRWARSIGAVESPRAEVAAIDADVLASALRTRATALSQPDQRASIHDLRSTVVLALELNAALDAAIPVDSLLCGAVALDLALRSRLPQRAVVTARTLIASDGDWQVGRGPALRAPGAAIVLFLGGRADVPLESVIADDENSGDALPAAAPPDLG